MSRFTSKKDKRTVKHVLLYCHKITRQKWEIQMDSRSFAEKCFVWFLMNISIGIGTGEFWGCVEYFSRFPKSCPKSFVRLPFNLQIFWSIVLLSINSHQPYKMKLSVFYSKRNIFGKENQSKTFILFSSVRLIDHSVENKGFETSVPEFSDILTELLRIMPEFLTNHIIWNCACTPTSPASTQRKASNVYFKTKAVYSGRGRPILSVVDLPRRKPDFYSGWSLSAWVRRRDGIALPQTFPVILKQEIPLKLLQPPLAAKL